MKKDIPLIFKDNIVSAFYRGEIIPLFDQTGNEDADKITMYSTDEARVSVTGHSFIDFSLPLFNMPEKITVTNGDKESWYKDDLGKSFNALSFGSFRNGLGIATQEAEEGYTHNTHGVLIDDSNFLDLLLDAGAVEKFSRNTKKMLIGIL